MGKRIAEIVTIVFIILKLTQIIDWSWWWVFSPLLILYGFVTLCYAIIGFAHFHKNNK